MRVGLFQYDMSWENKAENKSKILSILGASATKNLDWIIFPEMTLSGFSMDLNKTTLDDTDIDFFKNISKTHNCNVSFGGVVDSNNRNITIDRLGNLISQYSKIHLFGYGDETSHYKRGKEESSFVLDGAKIMPLVCYDLRFSYLFWDHAKSTDLFCIIASWPASRRAHWISLLKARAIENQCFVIGVNRLGTDPKLTYSGDSMVIDPMGKEILNCNDEEGLRVIEINVEEVSRTRLSFPFLKDRLK